ncbi:MAG: hypothetical protein ABW157_03180 [Candidatus Thiodiazotropha sp. LLP2]
MILLSKTRDAWQSSYFNETLKHELEAVDTNKLPLQQGLKLSSIVSEEPFNVMVMKCHDDESTIQVKVAIIYSGIEAGCNCADDPTPISTQPEYCEIMLSIDKISAETFVNYIQDS